jgi:hypothetical protein
VLQGQRIEVHPEAEECDGFRLEDDMLPFASPLSRLSNEDETLEYDPERLVLLVAGQRTAHLPTVARWCGPRS